MSEFAGKVYHTLDTNIAYTLERIVGADLQVGDMVIDAGDCSLVKNVQLPIAPAVVVTYAYTDIITDYVGVRYCGVAADLLVARPV